MLLALVVDSNLTVVIFRIYLVLAKHNEGSTAESA